MIEMMNNLFKPKRELKETENRAKEMSENMTKSEEMSKFKIKIKEMAKKVRVENPNGYYNYKENYCG